MLNLFQDMEGESSCQGIDLLNTSQEKKANSTPAHAQLLAGEYICMYLFIYIYLQSYQPGQNRACLCSAFFSLEQTSGRAN